MAKAAKKSALVVKTAKQTVDAKTFVAIGFAFPIDTIPPTKDMDRKATQEILVEKANDGLIPGVDLEAIANGLAAGLEGVVDGIFQLRVDWVYAGSADSGMTVDESLLPPSTGLAPILAPAPAPIPVPVSAPTDEHDEGWYTENDLKGLKKAELIAILEEFEIEHDEKAKIADLRDAIINAS